MKYNNMIQYKSKPIIIAIFGKSATGKDTLSRCLVSNLKHCGYAAQIIVSDTTRPPRENEVDGVDYNFLTNKQFYDKIDSRQYLEYSKFNGWLYGTNITAISDNKINVGVFNPEGLESLALWKEQYNIVCIYLNCVFFKRLYRSFLREEQKIKKEYFRRLYSDYCSFKGIEQKQKSFPTIVINTGLLSVPNQLRQIFCFFKDNKIL